MRRFAVRLSAVIAAGLVSGGCQYHRYSEKMLSAPGERASAADTEDVTLETANFAQLRGVPMQVQHAFALDYPTASVVRANRVPTGTGGAFYQIDYIESGSAGRAVYHADGSAPVADSGTVIIPEPSLVPITPPPPGPAVSDSPANAPTTGPAGASLKDFQ